MQIETLRLLWKVEFVDAADHYHEDPKSISVTETMGCLRRAYYDRALKYAVEPETLKARVWGTIIHEAREKANPDGHSEVRLSVDLGNGYTLDGTADRLTDDYVLDYKTMDNPRKTYDVDNATQLSIYDEMAGGEPRSLQVLQDGRRKEQVHEVHRVDNALEAAKERALEIIDAVEAKCPTMLAREGAQTMMKFTKKPMCNWCPHFETCEVDGD